MSTGTDLVFGVRPEFSAKWSTCGVGHGEEIGSIDATELLPAGYCYASSKFEHAGNLRNLAAPKYLHRGRDE